MFENKTEQQAKEEILKMVENTATPTIIRKKHFRKVTEFLMHPVYMTVQRW